MLTSISHVILIVENQDKAFNFYTQKLGFKARIDDYIGDIRLLTVSLPNQPNFELAFIQANTAEEKALVGRQASKYPLISVRTASIKKTCEELKAKGITIIDGPSYQKWGMSAYFEDLYGNLIYMVQPTAQ